MKRFDFLSLPLRIVLLFSFLLRLYGSDTGMVDPGQGRSNAQGTQYSYSLLSSDYFCHTSGLMEKVRNVLNTIPVFSKPTSQKSELAAVNIEKLIESSYFQYSYFSLSSIDCLEGPALVFPFHDFT